MCACVPRVKPWFFCMLGHSLTLGLQTQPSSYIVTLLEMAYLFLILCALVLCLLLRVWDLLEMEN